jgi:hypothetical protein
VWSLSLERLDDTVFFDVRTTWTHSADDTMWARLAEKLADALPFVSRSDATVTAAPLLEEPLAGAVEALRVCHASPDVHVRGCLADASLCRPAPGAPTADVRFPALAAVRESELETLSATVQLEVCTARCDRYLDRPGAPVRWDALDGCASGSDAP